MELTKEILDKEMNEIKELLSNEKDTKQYRDMMFGISIYRKALIKYIKN